GEFVPGEILKTLGNTEVRPERTTEFEGGFDADLFESRLTVSLTGYRKTTDDALLSAPVAPSVNGDGWSTLKNIGGIRNTGLEVTVAAELLRSGPVTWHTQVVLSRNQNTVVKLGTGVTPFYIETNPDGICNTLEHPSGCGGVRVVAGYPLFGRWSLPI